MMTDDQCDTLTTEVRKLTEVGAMLVERVEDVAASIRYLTNNLLDETYHPELAAGVRELAEQTSRLISLSPATDAEQAIPRFCEHVAETATACKRCLEAEPEVPESREPRPEGVDSLDSHHRPPSSDNRELFDSQYDQASVLSPAIQSRLALLLDGLRSEAEQLSVAQATGEEAAQQWWKARFTSVVSAVDALEYLEEESLGAGVELAPHVDRLGGVPTMLCREAWPVELATQLAENMDAEYNDSEEGEPLVLDEVPAAQRELFDGQPRPEPDAPSPVEKASSDSTTAVVEEEPASGVNLDGAYASPEDIPTNYTLDDYRTFCQRREQQPLSAAEWKSEYAALRASRDHFLEELQKSTNAQQLKNLAARFGSFDAHRSTKKQNAASVYLACLKSFLLSGSLQFDPLSESIEEAIDRIVEALTEESFAAHHQEQLRKQAEQQKALENPETLLEFHTFVRERGEAALSDQQHLLRDRLYADMSRQTRSERQSTSVDRFQSVEIEVLEFSIKQGFHEKRNCPLWIVQLSTRVDRATYGELKQKASQLGGWYSSFKKDDAGFQFLSQGAAEKFTGLKEGSVDRSDQLEDRRIRKLTNTAERFSTMAARLSERAEEALAADGEKLKNTARRAEQAARISFITSCTR